MHQCKRTALGVLAVLFTCSLPVIADELPVIFFEQGTHFTDAERNQILRQIPATFKTTLALPGTLSIVLHAASKAELDEMLNLFQIAQNQYFDGDFQAAQNTFISLKQTLESSLPSVTFHNRLRELHRDVLIFLAMLAKESNLTDKYNAYLSEIIRNHPNPQVSSKLFPPWIKEAILHRQQRTPVPQQQLILQNIEGCSVRIDGRTMSISDLKVSLPIGMHTVMSDCGAHKQSFTSRVELGDTPVRWQPVYHSHKKISYLDSTMVVHSSQPESIDSIRQFISMLGKQLPYKRLFVAMKSVNGISAFIFSADTENFIYHVTPSQNVSNDRHTDLAPLFSNLPERQNSNQHPIYTQKNRVRKPLAWIVLGAGISLSGIGLAMGMKYGSPSSQEPAIWMAQLSGLALTATGVSLLIVPVFTEHTASRAMGIQTQINF
ncbi:MAG: hypothetical protein JXX29_16030 [Deltaproteobacteria bacterium]|nr:hypothetical protein [Deltaproteobacteria bacterium]MBN2673191.1 hypothetical protein [Deltaproteobacteria bacterium]